jgi:lysozyme
MKTGVNGIDLIKRHEGYRPAAYQDSRGIWTIGYGHAGNDVIPGQVINETTAQDYLRRDLFKAEYAVNHLVTVPLTQNQFDALVSFVYNLGGNDLKASHLLQYLNAYQYIEAADEFLKFDKCRINGKKTVLKELTNRRIEETDLFLEAE